ncbi:13S globulin seed storage protein 2-like isoform X3 [Solanum pennellii]|uniref:13S globulin seed storage protein 2-like isoform X3 n=1 Tax=Solanum pennellii TaxID=28526 RepID=A0ABM1FRG8_SOLPN|nr:13S globulin seed storage protein 2-like isoform X3 [Solanum pennellii]
MDIILSSKKADKTIVEVEGVGGYYTWSSSQFPVLSQKKVAAGLILLQPRGFALPHYTDSSKIAYVCEGECIAGLISPEDSKEEVVKIQKGDTIPVTLGTVSWWYNAGDSKLAIILLGESSDEYTPGEYCFFFLTGAAGILNGFPNEIIAKSFHMTETESEKFMKDQSSLNILIKVNEGIPIPSPSHDAKCKLVFNLDGAKPCVEAKNGGVLSSVSGKNIALLGDAGLSANRVVLECGAVLGPIFTADSSVQLSYITKGSGRVVIVGLFGKVVLDTKVEEGELFFVPKFFPFVVEADEGGMEFFSVKTSSKQVYGELSGGKKSIWEAASPSIVEAFLNMTPDFTKSFKSKIAKGSLITPP